MSIKSTVLAGLLTAIVALPAASQEPPVRRLGIYYGINLRNANNHRVGLQYIGPAFDVFELYPSLDVFLDPLADGSEWQASIMLRGRWNGPDGNQSPLYVGGGLVFLSDLIEPAVLLGAEVRRWRVRPYLELRLVGTDVDLARVDLIGGFALPLGRGGD
jgi:hypothetical protein